jgi:hypothetical protein
MIKNMDICCHLNGEKFSPILVEQQTGIMLANKIKVGDLLTKGVNKGKPSSYGSGELRPPYEYTNTEDYGLLWIAETLSTHIEIIRNNGADNIDLIIGVFYEGQCNFVFESNALKKIGELSIPLQISCYESY